LVFDVQIKLIFVILVETPTTSLPAIKIETWIITLAVKLKAFHKYSTSFLV
jgi:hypothetical protein